MADSQALGMPSRSVSQPLGALTCEAFQRLFHSVESASLMNVPLVDAETEEELQLAADFRTFVGA
ncbi:hypothetical protein GCM10009682_53580 [Luedemannella flava]|uniref:Uncharacterized protein n=1 Tax=Luedemannella flava TaxID=349316 RepID=A0ABP4YQJ1_9ACTN